MVCWQVRGAEVSSSLTHLAPGSTHFLLVQLPESLLFLLPLSLQSGHLKEGRKEEEGRKGGREGGREEGRKGRKGGGRGKEMAGRKEGEVSRIKSRHTCTFVPLHIFLYTSLPKPMDLLPLSPLPPLSPS